jgi:toxin ParE1/3/4
VKLVWSPLALERLVEIGESLAVEQPIAAGKWVEGAFDAVVRLRRFPLSGRSVPEIRRTDLREVIYGAFRIIYRVDQDRVVVLTIRHARQQLLAGDPDLA